MKLKVILNLTGVSFNTVFQLLDNYALYLQTWQHGYTIG